MISTHVLDTARGAPAAGVAVRLWRINGEERELMATGQTNADGRVAPLFGGELEPGTYVLLFSAGEYYREINIATFFEDIPVHFVIEKGAGNYHIPLLLAPFAYSTYRGS